MKIVDRLKDRWLTWVTGKTRERREWEAWQQATINQRAETIQGMFKNFQHVIEVDPEKFLVDHAIVWVPHPGLKLSTGAVIRSARKILFPGTKLSISMILNTIQCLC